MEGERKLQDVINTETTALGETNFNLFGAIYLSAPEGGSRIKPFKLAPGESNLDKIESFSAAVAATIFLALNESDPPAEAKQIGRGVALDAQGQPLDTWKLQTLVGSYCIDPWQPPN